MIFNTTFNNIQVISCQSVLLETETGVPRESHRPVASHWQNFITKCCIEYTSPWVGFELTTFLMIGTGCTGSCKSNINVLILFIYMINFSWWESCTALSDDEQGSITKGRGLVKNFQLSNLPIVSLMLYL